jgi:hydroxyethylthiazole kinase-like sugar kinase family protein
MQTAPADVRTLSEVRDALLRLYGEARDIGEHQVAYHALAGALHAAESLRQPDVLDQVAALAREHRKRIDQDDPRHPLSSQSASIRGHQSIFEQLAITCAAVRVRLKAEDLVRK